MLIKAQYLDKQALVDYIASVEGGVRQTESSTSTSSHGIGGGLAIGPAKAQADRKGGEEWTLTIEDHDLARLNRLIEAGHRNSEELAWVDVGDPDHDFKDIGYGAMVEWECDIHIPEPLAAISRPEEFRRFIGQANATLSAAKALNMDISDMPDVTQLSAMDMALQGLNIPTLIVGEDYGTSWKVSGTLDEKWTSKDASLDDRVRIIGKVKKRIPDGKWYPLGSLPGMNIVGRQQRREMERRGPETGQEAQFLAGPLLILDILAIYS